MESLAPAGAGTSSGTCITPKSIKTANITEIIMRINPIARSVYPKIFSAFPVLFCCFMENEHSCGYKSFIPKLNFLFLPWQGIFGKS
jgi:hypothetical protein